MNRCLRPTVLALSMLATIAGPADAEDDFAAFLSAATLDGGLLSGGSLDDGLADDGLADDGLVASEPENIGLGDRQRDPDSPAALTLADVMASTLRSFPEIVASRAEFERTDGDLVSAFGQYDTKLKAYSLNEPLGFYEMYRQGLGVARQTWWGSQLEGGYKIGRGTFKPWYKERQTDEAGEFRLAVRTPLLMGRAIDPDRVAVFQASLRRSAADPTVAAQILQTSGAAAASYWQWVTAGAVLQAQDSLTRLAERRTDQLAAGVEAGKFAEIDAVLNRQLLAERRGKSVESELKLRTAAIKLSLYLRDPTGLPLVPPPTWLPDQFPPLDLPEIDVDQLIAASLQRRPELQLLRLERESVVWDRQLACNQMLPSLDFVSEVSKDMGEPATKTDDKGPLELLVGIESQVPVQRRKARGKIRSSNAKVIQIDQKMRLTRDKIATQIEAGVETQRMTVEVVRFAEESYEAALESLQRYRFAFDRGKIDLLYLNLIETKATEDLIKLIQARSGQLSTLAEFQIALGLDPMDAAVLMP